MLDYRTTNVTKRYNTVRVYGAIAVNGSKYVQVKRGKRGVGNGATRKTSPWIPLGDFQGQAKEAAAVLEKSGMLFFGSELTELKEHLTDFDDFEEMPVFVRQGWDDDGRYAFADGDAYGVDDDDKAAFAFPTDPAIYDSKGSLKDWRRNLAAPLAGHDLPEFCLMAGLASALLGPAEHPHNFGFELVGPPKSGKSTIANAVASIVGPADGVEGGFVISMNATANAINQIMGGFHDLPLVLEEWNLTALRAGANAGTNSAQLIADLADGHERLRHNSTKRGRSRFIWLTSTNQAWYEQASSLPHDVVRAYADRMMTIPVDDIDDGGVFDASALGGHSLGSLAKRVAAASHQYHGTAYRAFVEYLVGRGSVEDDDDLGSEIAKMLRQFDRILANRGLEVDERMAPSLGLVYAAGRLAKKAGVLPDAFNPKRAVLAVLGRILGATAALKPPVSILQELVRSSGCADWRNKKEYMPAKRFWASSGVVRSSRTGDELVLTRDQLAALPIETKRLLNDPQVRKLLKRVTDRPTSKRTIIFKEEMPMYCFRLDALMAVKA